jgi:4-hydroxy-tetrahydrodipicolinate reductase
VKIAIIGYGKMGKAIEKLAVEAGHEVIVRIDSEEDWEKCGNTFSKADVAIEFSSPKVVVANIRKCFDANIPVVVGTTAWENELQNIRETCLSGNHSMFVASNYSIGVNIFNKISLHLATLMNDQTNYEVKLSEIHHSQKADAPSGTAKVLANGIISQVDRKEKWVNQETSKSDEIGIISHRVDEVPGTHLVTWFSDEDDIEIKHTAKNRIGFAKGALLAAGFLIGKKGFFCMDDLLFG